MLTGMFILAVITVEAGREKRAPIVGDILGGLIIMLDLVNS